MIQAAFYAAIAGLTNLVGGVLVTAGVRGRTGTLNVLVAFGAGFMLAVALLEMLPGALGTEGGLTAVLAGYLAVHLTQHTLTPHFHFGEETHREAMVSRGVGLWALIGLVPHAFFDGVAISSGFLAGRELGMLISLPSSCTRSRPASRSRASCWQAATRRSRHSPPSSS